MKISESTTSHLLLYPGLSQQKLLVTPYIIPPCFNLSNQLFILKGGTDWIVVITVFAKSNYTIRLTEMVCTQGRNVRRVTLIILLINIGSDM